MQWGTNQGFFDKKVINGRAHIDALTVGISFSFLRISIFVPEVAIGVVAFLLSFAGAYLGGKVGHFLRNRVEILGGLIFVVIGVRILVEHLSIS